MVNLGAIGIVYDSFIAKVAAICVVGLADVSCRMAWLRTLLALVALIGAVAHGPAMADAPKPVASSQMTNASDCHSEVASADADAAKPGKPKPADCCPDGCNGDCTMVAALLSGLPVRHAVVYLRAARDLPVTAALVSSRTFAAERPPKTLA